MRSSIVFYILMAFFTLCGPAQAGGLFDLDPTKSRLIFKVDNYGYSKAIGSFEKFEGQFYLDEQDPENSKVSVRIDVRSLDMGDKAWEKTLLGTDFFALRFYPYIVFKSTRVDIIGREKARVTGDIEMLGFTRPLSMEVQLNHVGMHPSTKEYTAGFSIQGALNRSDFGMIKGLPLIGDQVAFEIEVEGVRARNLSR